jgi:hypothetical protein
MGEPAETPSVDHPLGEKLVNPFKRPPLTLKQRAKISKRRCISRMGIKREELKALVERNGDSAAKEFSLANWKQDVEDALYSVSKKSNGFEWTLGNNTDPIRDIATPDAFLISTSFESQLVENLTASKFIKKKRITHSSALPIRRKPFGARATETNPRSKRLHTAGDTIPTAQERVEALANVGQKNIQKRLKTADHMVSNEMKVSSKENLIETIGTGIWDDKMLSQLSRPLTSEQFCGSGSFTVEQQHLNAPKYMEPITHTGAPAAEDSRTEDHLSKNSPAEDIIAQDGDTPIEKDATHSKAPAMSKLGCCFKTKTAKALNINKIAKALDTNENPANKDQPQEPIDAETSLQNENTDAIENEEGEDFLAQDVFSEEEPGAEEERTHNGEQGEEQEQMEHLSESLEDDDNVAVSDEENACNKGTSLVRDKLSFESADEDEILSFFYTPISTMVSPLLRRKLASIITDKL